MFSVVLEMKFSCCCLFVVIFLNLESSVMNSLRTHMHFLKLDLKEEHDLLLAVLKGKTREVF